MKKTMRIFSFICFNYAIFLCYGEPFKVILIQLGVFFIYAILNMLFLVRVKKHEWMGNAKDIHRDLDYLPLIRIQYFISSVISILVKNTLCIYLSQIMFFYVMNLSVYNAVVTWYSFVLLGIVIYVSFVLFNTKPNKNSNNLIDILFYFFNRTRNKIDKKLKKLGVYIFEKYFEKNIFAKKKYAEQTNA